MILDLTRFSSPIYRFLLPPQLVSFHLSAPGRNPSRPLKPRLLLLAGGFGMGAAVGRGDDSLYSWASCCARHPARLREGCGVVADFLSTQGSTHFQWWLSPRLQQMRHGLYLNTLSGEKRRTWQRKWMCKVHINAPRLNEKPAIPRCFIDPYDQTEYWLTVSGVKCWLEELGLWILEVSGTKGSSFFEEQIVVVILFIFSIDWRKLKKTLRNNSTSWQDENRSQTKRCVKLFT